MSEKYQWFDGKKFTRDDRTGYYLNSTIRKRLHIYVWEYYNGKVPKGYEVHHIDFDRANNDITNLQLLLVSDHRKLHAKSLTQDQRNWKRDNLAKNARPLAAEWHKSDEGRAWHRAHAQVTLSKAHRRIDKQCIFCGKSYIGDAKSKFCSNACKSAYRRSMGLDLVPRRCVVCGNEFTADKYTKIQTCSRHCAGVYRWRMKNESQESD